MRTVLALWSYKDGRTRDNRANTPYYQSSLHRKNPLQKKKKIPNHEMIPYVKTIGNGGEEELPFNRKRTLTEPG